MQRLEAILTIPDIEEEMLQFEGPLAEWILTLLEDVSVNVGRQ